MKTAPTPGIAALPAFDDKTKDLNTITETPKGDRNKIDWNPETGLFEISKVLPEGHVFPYDFGFIPGTRGPDGDPLDVLLLIETPIGFPGCLVRARLVGVIEAEQTEGGKTIRNDRLIAVTTASRLYENVRSLHDLPPSIPEEIEHFFVSYNEMEGKKFTPTGRGGPDRATEIVRKGIVKPD